MFSGTPMGKRPPKFVFETQRPSSGTPQPKKFKVDRSATHNIVTSTERREEHVKWLLSATVAQIKAKSLHERLGILRSDDLDTVNKAYRILALQTHPDKVGNTLKDAGARFGLISEAKDVLGDERQRQKYENGDESAHSFESFYAKTTAFKSFYAKTTGRRKGSGFAASFANLYESMFNTPMADEDERRRKRAQKRASAKCPPHVINVACTFEELALGAEKSVYVKLKTTTLTKGVASNRVRKTFKVPRGSIPGGSVILRGEGDHYGGIKPGDLIFKLTQQPHKFFVRADQHVHCKIEIPIADALFGGSFKVITLEGKFEEIQIEGPIFGSTKYKIQKRGAYRSANSDERGDLIVNFALKKPTRPMALSAETEDIVREALKTMYDD